MERKLTKTPKLYTAQGSIFDIEGGGFDGIIVFLESGFNDINGEYLAVKDFLEKSPIPVLAFGNCAPNNYFQHVSEFPSVSIALDFVKQAADQTLSALASAGCKNIGFHGIRIYGIDDYNTESYSAKAVTEWVRRHENIIESVTLVDRFDCYLKHFI